MNFNQVSNVIFNLDDAAPDYESNAMNFLIEFKALYPKFKVTLFAILGRWLDLGLLKQIAKFEWIEFAAHGFEHLKNDEVLEWNEKRWSEVLKLYENVGIFKKIWKSPNWQTSEIGYKVLKDCGWAIAIRQHQLKEVPIGMKYYNFEGNPFSVHGHTWTMVAHVKEGMFKYWCATTNFEFVSENLEEKI